MAWATPEQNRAYVLIELLSVDRVALAAPRGG